MEIISSIYNSGYNIKKFYLGSQELKLAFLGNQVIYDEVVGDNDLNYIFYEFYKSDTLSNTVEAPFKSAILKGNTKYRDIDTGDILDTFDETKNLELVSVKMPVLTTTGKNLFDINKCKPGRAINDNGNEVTGLTPDYYAYGEFIPINNEFTMSITSNNGSVPNNANGTRLRFYDEDKNLVDSQWFAQSFKESNGRKYRTISMNGAKYLKISFSATGGSADTTYEAMQTIQIEEGSTATSFEPYKSNILIVNEDVTLRGVGDVQDTLDCLTGEVTERIGEDIYNGSKNEYWFYSGTTDSSIEFARSVSNVERLIACDKLPISGTTERFVYASNKFYVRVLKSKLSTLDVDGFNKWLSTNPITVQYKLATESVKTVDLTMVDQDGQTISKLNSFNGTTHISTEAAENSIYPTIAIEVATE